ncbi:MAG: peptide MFS transporter [Gemmatimonadales bacterium]|nr:peptide MFS transporter [Gemmatimonadales bacterium]
MAHLPLSAAGTAVEPPLAGSPAPAPTAVLDARFFGHPRGLSTLFFTEMWERFSYYGMRALLILFMTAPVAAGGLGFDTAKAGPIYALYVSSVYLLALPGGWVADRVLGLRPAVMVGGAIIMVGHICLALPSLSTFYLGLVLIAVGTGLLKSNVSVLVGKLYAPDDVRRDAGYSVYYMGINTGGFLAPLITGWLGQSDSFKKILVSMDMNPESSWHWGFGAAAVGMFCGLVQYSLGGKYLSEDGRRPVRPADPVAAARVSRQTRLIGLGALSLIALTAVLVATGTITLDPEAISRGFKWVLLGVTSGFFAWLLFIAKWSPEERRRLVVVAILFVAATVFWMAYEQAGSTLNLFAERSTDNVVLGRSFPASWYQSVPSLFVIVFAAVFGALWLRLGARNPSSAAKFTLGLAFLGVAFAIMIGASSIAATGVRVSPWWLVGSYLLQVWGELCLSPVGLSAMSSLAPRRIAGLVMGVWFLALSVGSYLAGMAASVYETMPLPTLFTLVTATALVAGVVMALLIRPIGRMLREG